MQSTNICSATSFIVLIFMVIGIITFHMGCNTDMGSECATLTFVKGVPFQYTISKQVCSSGSGSNKQTYTCYTSWVEMHYGNNQTCHLEVGEKIVKRAHAEERAQEYIKGQSYDLFRSKEHPDTCIEPSNQKTLWIVGVVFLTLSSVCSLGVMAYMYKTCSQSAVLKVDPHPDFLFRAVHDIESCTISTRASMNSVSSHRDSVPRMVVTRKPAAVAREFNGPRNNPYRPHAEVELVSPPVITATVVAMDCLAQDENVQTAEVEC